jgi:putative transposase
MPRQPRLDAPGLVQHIMARGIERREIFQDDKDRKSFLDRLAVILEETQAQCYAWALIPNHFHILLRTGPTPISNVMRRLMTGYAVAFNIRHRRSGHLFQNRYKSIICEEDPYLLELIRYIHLNPLRAKLVQDLKGLDKYPWSGHSAILGHRKNPLIPDQTQNQDKSLSEMTIEEVLLHFGDARKLARRRYREFVEKGIAQGRRSEFQGGGLVRPACHARDVNIWKQKNSRIVQTMLERQVAGKARAGRSAGGNKDGLVGRKKEISQARALICHFAINDLSYSASEVARSLAISRVNVGRCADRGKKVLHKYQDLKNIVQ